MSGFGLGYAPVASGTFGSAGALCISVIVWAAWPAEAVVSIDAAWVALFALSSIGCVVWGPWAVGYYAKRARKAGDPGHVVLDEFAGQWVALIAIPLPIGYDQVVGVMAVFATQFFFFRLFDVIKPPPARQFEKLPAGWGILMDDIAAAVYANLIGQVLFRVIFVLH